MQVEPYVRNDWSCEDVCSVSVSECTEVVCCCPCVYAAAFSREYSIVPTQPRPLCSCSVGGCIVGGLLPPVAGVVVRARQLDTEGCGDTCVELLRAVVYETCCCICVGAPCAMNEYRCEAPMQIGQLLLDSSGEFTVVDSTPTGYMASPVATTEPPCPAGSSPATTEAGSPPSPPPATEASLPSSATVESTATARTGDRSESDSDNQ